MIRCTLGCSLEDYRAIPEYHDLPVINIENPLYPGYLDGDLLEDIHYLTQRGKQELVLDGPYIDLNLGSPEPQARALALRKTRKTLEYASQCGAGNLIFLSTFLPLIGLASYERGWIEQSILSWQEILTDIPAGLQIALANTFEYTPDPLLEVVQRINHPQLNLAFDVGHCLVWGKLDVLEWYRRVRNLCRIVYLHSNDGFLDEHRSIQVGKVAEENILARLKDVLHPDTLLILKYFDRKTILNDLEMVDAIIHRIDI